MHVIGEKATWIIERASERTSLLDDGRQCHATDHRTPSSTKQQWLQQQQQTDADPG